MKNKWEKETVKNVFTYVMSRMNNKWEKETVKNVFTYVIIYLYHIKIIISENFH